MEVRRTIAAGLSAGVAVALLSACSPEGVSPATRVSPDAISSAPAGGAGTYQGEATSASGSPIAVGVTITSAPSTPPNGDALAVRGFLDEAGTALSLDPARVQFLQVQVDNRNQIDAVPLPADVDILDSAGVGADFRPAYAVVAERQSQLDSTTRLAKRGAAISRRLEVRDDLVRPGKLLRVLYVSPDPLVDVAQVIVNGNPANKVTAAASPSPSQP